MYIEEFDMQLIERYLTLRGLKFYRGVDGRDVLVRMSSERRKLHVRLRVSGFKRDILTVQVSPAEHFDASERHRLMELVNGWNRDTRWPKAYVRETSDPARVGVVGESCYPLMDGIHVEALANFVDYTIRGAFELFDRIAQSIELPSARSLERWLRDAG